jgi:hypothetical protein
LYYKFLFGKLLKDSAFVNGCKSIAVRLVLGNFVLVENLIGKHLHVIEMLYIFAITSISWIFLATLILLFRKSVGKVFEKVRNFFERY